MSVFRQKTINAIAWSATGSVGAQIVIFIVGIILARLLSPREFGLIAMITVFTGFASIFGELGFSAALIHRQAIRQEHLSSVFWLNVCAGLILTLIFILCSPLIADFYGEPMLIPLTMFISANFLIRSLTIIQQTLLTKSLDFRMLSIVEFVGVGVSGTAAITLAYLGFGVWSLAVQSVIGSMLTVILFWKISDWRPSLGFNWSAITDLSGFSMNLFGTTVLNYLARNLDTLLIGRFLSTAALGIYSRSYSIMLLPLNNVSRVISRVMFPSLSLIQEDNAKVKQLYLKMTGIVALATFPMMLGLFVTAEPFVFAVLGPQWAPMIPILRIFSLVGLFQSIGTLNGNLYLSQGRADLQFRIGLALKTNVLLGIVVGLYWGVNGVALGYAITALINTYPAFFFAGRLVNLSFSKLLQNLSGIFGCAVTMMILIQVFSFVLPTDCPHWIRLIVEASLGMVIYLILIHLFRLKPYLDIRELICEQWQRRFVNPDAVTD